tara:strand:- start:62 stop:1210 length:1149 start_codon:yes stop_codon:yes gene_type:complete
MINKRGTVCLATSLGKMFVFLHALHTMEKNDDIHLFLAETTARKVDLRDSIKTFDEKFNKDTLNDYNLKFYCYQTVYKWKGKSFGLVTCDECHVQLSPSYIQFHKFNKYKAVLGLSATIDRDTEYESRGVTFTKGDMLDKYMPICYLYTLDKARTNDINREVDIHIIYNELDHKNECITTRKNGKTLLTELQAYKHWNKRLAQSMFADPSKREIIAYMAINGRSKLLYNLPSKTRIVKKLLPHLDNILIFGNSIDSLLTVTDNVISSRNSEKKNNFIRHQFETGKENIIASFKMLEQGATIKGMQNMIMMSYYSKSLGAIQKMGRHRKIGDSKGNAFILVTKDTQEEKWLSKFIGNFKSYNIIKHENVNLCIKYLKNEKYDN